MHTKKRSRKRIVAAILSAVMVIGSVTGSMPESMVHATEDVTVQEENWYVLGRPMTEEEIEEQLQQIAYYRSFLGEIPQEERKESLSIESNNVLSSYSMRSQETEEQTSVDLPVKYSSVEQGYTTAVRNQNPYGICWAQAAIGLMEISMVKNKLASANDLSLSIPHAIYYYFRPVTDPLGGTSDDYAVPQEKSIYSMLHGGGSMGFLADSTMAWMGPVLTDDFHDFDYLYANHYNYDSSDALNNVEDAYGNRAAIVTEMVYVNKEQRDEMKKMILEYGGVGIDYYSSQDYYNPNFAAQYCPDQLSYDHAVVIVGWNDYFPKENFDRRPSQDGAWLVRNSWGAGYGNNGYFWISYEDQSLSKGRVLKVVAADKYDNNYQYDGIGGTYDLVYGDTNTELETVNVFEIQKDRELLKAVQFATWETGYNYSIQIYKNPQNVNDPASGEPLLETPITGIKENDGRFTVDLEQPVWLEMGDKIAVSVTFSSTSPTGSPKAEVDRPGSCKAEQSYYRVDGGTWTDCATVGKGNFLIKAFTSDAEGSADAIHEHNWSGEWNYDGDYHWHECIGEGTCDAALTDSSREYEKHHGGTATCIAKARCVDCDQEYGRILTDQHTGDEVCTVCGKDIPPEERKGAINPSYEFTTITEEKVSSKANGKPKLIILMGARCEISRSTINNLTSERLSGVDIYAVDVNHYQKEDVEAFKASLNEGAGKEDIKFCYDPDRGTAIRQAYMKAYTEVYPDASTTPLPLICYIDEQNNFKYMSSGLQDVEQVRKNLILYCGYEVNNLNVANPTSATFTTIEDTEVSATAEGKPKVLVFFHAEGCISSRETLSDIAQNVPKGIDIYAIEMIGREKEKVVNFRDTYTGAADGIDYCYGGNPIEALVSYMQAAGLDNSQIPSPVICYIDADNNLQYVSTGVATNEEMRKILSTCCNFEEPDVPIDPVVVKLLLNKPDKTTYLIGEALDLDGGTVAVEGGEPTVLTDAMVTGFTSTQQGEVSLKVEYKGGETSFNVLVINKPILEATEGTTLADVEIPGNDYGTFTWEDTTIRLEGAGSQSYRAVFTPTDIENYSILENIEITVQVQEEETITPPIDPDPPVDPNPPVDPDPPVDPNPPVDPDPPIDPNPPVDPDPPVDPNPPVDRNNPFVDVGEGAFYYDSVMWAVEKEITDGWTDTLFAPDMGCTRGQVVTFLWRAAGEPKAKKAENPFVDVTEKAYYYDAVLWAVEKGITDGWTDTLFAPDMECTRGQIVTFIWRAAGEPKADNAENPFEDIASNAYYYDAVLWAVEKQITDGWLPTEFAPDMECTRGQIVTFLYRYHNSAE